MKPVSYFATHITLYILMHCVISSLATVTTTNDPINVVCPDGYDGLLPDPYDCHYFYICSFHSPSPVLQRCPYVLYFIPEANRCEYREEGYNDCFGITQPPTTTTTTTTEVPTTQGNPIDWVCPADYVGMIRHPYDCRRFYICDPAHVPSLLECPSPPSLYFSPITGRCEYSRDVADCQGGSPPPTGTTPKYS